MKLGGVREEDIKAISNALDVAESFSINFIRIVMNINNKKFFIKNPSIFMQCKLHVGFLYDIGLRIS